MNAAAVNESGPRARPFDSLALFTWLWASGILIHQAYHAQFTINWHDGLLIAAALAALVRPSSIPRLTALCLAQLIEVLVELPLVVNHWLLAGIGSLTVLTVLTARPGRRGDGTWDRAALYQAISPPLRLVIVGTYAFAFLAKLNWDFFDPVQSCANMLYPRMAGRVGLPTAEWTRMPVVWFTIAVEGLIPLLLLLRRTRVHGAFAAFVFHVMLGLAGFYDFSAVAAGFLVLFLPDDMPQRLTALRTGSRWLNAACGAVVRIGASPVAWPAALAASYVVMRNVPRIASPFSFTMPIWFVAAVLMLGAAVLTLSRGGPWPAASHLRVARAPWLLGPVLILVNGLSPYVGLKTEHSFTMFSNLMTEGPHWNHVFMPRSLRVFGMQDEVIRVIDSSEPHIRRYAERRRPLVTHSFRWLVSHYPSASVVYERGGERFQVPRVGDDPLLSERPANAVLAKILLFRVVRPSCGH